MTEVSFVNTVDLSKLDILLFEGGRGLLIMRCESLAMSTPWREELYQDHRFGIDGGLEGGSSKAEDVGGTFGEGEGGKRQERGWRRKAHWER